MITATADLPLSAAVTVEDKHSGNKEAAVSLIIGEDEVVDVAAAQTPGGDDFEDELFTTTEDEEDDESGSKAGSLSSPSATFKISTSPCTSPPLPQQPATISIVDVTTTTTTTTPAPPPSALPVRPNRLRMPLQRALTLPSNCKEQLRSPRHHCGPPIISESDANDNNEDGEDCTVIITVPSNVSASSTVAEVVVVVVVVTSTMEIVAGC